MGKNNKRKNQHAQQQQQQQSHSQVATQGQTSTPQANMSQNVPNQPPSFEKESMEIAQEVYDLHQQSKQGHQTTTAAATKQGAQYQQQDSQIGYQSMPSQYYAIAGQQQQQQQLPRMQGQIKPPQVHSNNNNNNSAVAHTHQQHAAAMNEGSNNNNIYQDMQMQQQQQQFRQGQAQAAQKQAAKFQAQFDPSQYQSFNQVDKNLQELQESFNKQTNQRQFEQQAFQSQQNSRRQQNHMQQQQQQQQRVPLHQPQAYHQQQQQQQVQHQQQQQQQQLQQQQLQQQQQPHPPQQHNNQQNQQHCGASHHHQHQHHHTQHQHQHQRRLDLSNEDYNNIRQQLEITFGRQLDNDAINDILMGMRNNGIYMDQQNNNLQFNYNGHNISTDCTGSQTSHGDHGSQNAYYQTGQPCPKGNYPCHDIGCCMQSAAIVHGNDEQHEDDEEEEEDDDEYEDEEEYYGETEEMQYDNEENLMNDCGQNQEDEEDDEDEEEYENEYQEDQDDETEPDTQDTSYIHQQTSKYDYGTDNEEEKEVPMQQEQVFSMRGGGVATVGPYQDQQCEQQYSQDSQGNSYLKMKVNQTEISQEDFNNFLHRCTLTLPPQLSQKFVRLSKEFNNNIDYIMNYVYKLVGQQSSLQGQQIQPQIMNQLVVQQQQQNVQTNGQNQVQTANGQIGQIGTEKNKFQNKYDNLIKQSTELCRKYTGPHSVLQIFLEKIIACIGQISLQIKHLAKNELQLWKEYKTVIRRPSTLQRSSSADSGLLITTTSNQQQTQDKNNQGNNGQRLIRPTQIDESFNISVRFKPLLQNIEAYMRFLQEVQSKYIFIMKQCAVTVSKHFTSMTAVIIEGNSYEFPSIDLHKAIINKLIMNDSQHFKQFFAHIRRQYKRDEALIKERHPEFTKLIDSFMQQVEDSQKIINIDQYMKDLKRHAIAEYKTLYEREQQTNANSDSKSKRKKKRDKLRKAQAAAAAANQNQQQQQFQPQQQQNQQPPQNQSQQQQQQQQRGVQQPQQQQQYQNVPQAQSPAPAQYNNGGQQQNNYKRSPQAQQQQYHQQQTQFNNQMQQQNPQYAMQNQQIHQDPNQPGLGSSNANKKKRNRKRKNKEGKLTAEEIHSMPTDDLCNYIENKANQTEGGVVGGNIPGQGGRLGSSGPMGKTQTQGIASQQSAGQKAKKRAGQPMNIDDQEARKLEKQIMEDFSKLDQAAISQHLGEQFKNMSMKDIQNTFQQIKNQQRQKHNFNQQQQQMPGKRVNDSHAAAIPSDHIDQNMLYADDIAMTCSGASCNYCQGQIVTTHEGLGEFIHDENCCFRGEYDSELEQDQNDNGDEIYEQDETTAEGYDYEGDIVVEELKRRFERIQYLQQQQQNRRKLKPNVSNEWISKLKEHLRLTGGSPAPPQPESTSNERVYNTNQKGNRNYQAFSGSQKVGK